MKLLFFTFLITTIVFGTLWVFTCKEFSDKLFENFQLQNALQWQLVLNNELKNALIEKQIKEQELIQEIERLYKNSPFFKKTTKD
jgi:hypothetical protein